MNTAAQLVGFMEERLAQRLRALGEADGPVPS